MEYKERLAELKPHVLEFRDKMRAVLAQFEYDVQYMSKYQELLLMWYGKDFVQEVMRKLQCLRVGLPVSESLANEFSKEDWSELSDKEIELTLDTASAMLAESKSFFANVYIFLDGLNQVKFRLNFANN